MSVLSVCLSVKKTYRSIRSHCESLLGAGDEAKGQVISGVAFSFVGDQADTDWADGARHPQIVGRDLVTTETNSC